MARSGFAAIFCIFSALLISFGEGQRRILQDLRVVYTDNGQPGNALREVHGGNPDINKGFGGKFVWLVPSWTDSYEGVTGIEFARQSQPTDGYDDLAKGAGGDFRYLKIYRDRSSHERIVDIALYRNPAGNPKDEGWNYVSTDLNQGRGKDFLYLVWKVMHV